MEIYKKLNQLKFGKGKICKLCESLTTCNKWPAGKYVVATGNKAYVFHYGTHNCLYKKKIKDPLKLCRIV